jgi:geranyl-CoA carboxylase beta subunit
MRCCALQAKVVAESDSKRDKFAQRGQLLPRERVARLIDRGTDFLELSPLAGLGLHDDDGKKACWAGASVIGIGVVAGKRVLVSASDSAIKGGTVAPMGLKKALRAQEIAAENRLPLIYLVESGGANLMYQSEMFVEGGRSFANQARLSAQGHAADRRGARFVHRWRRLPAGPVGLRVLVADRSSIYLAGPPLVKAAIGEDASDEELGGAEMHASVTGLGEYLARTTPTPRLVRELLASCPGTRRPRRAPPSSTAAPGRGTAGRGARRRARTLRRARGHRPPGRRLGLPRVQGRLRPDTVCGHARLHGHASA